MVENFGTAYVREMLRVDRNLLAACDAVASEGAEAVKAAALRKYERDMNADQYLLFAMANWESIAADLTLQIAAARIVKEMTHAGL